MKTGLKIKQMRVLYKISQEELAEKINVSQVTVSKWEQGKSIKHEYLPIIAKVLQVSFEYLLNDAIKMEPVKEVFIPEVNFINISEIKNKKLTLQE